MDPLKNLSSDFNSALKTAAKDKVIDIKELEALKNKVKTEDDKAVVGMFIKDTTSVNFKTKEGKSEIEYHLKFFESTEEPKPKTDPAKYEPYGKSYSSLGEGDKTKASNVAEQPGVSPPIGSLDSIAKDYNTPEKVAGLLGSINYDTERGKPLGGDGPLGAQKPEDTLKTFSGVCRDIHQVGAYLLSQNGYEAIQVGYVGARTSHSITVYKEPGGQGYGIVEYGKVYSPEKIKSMLGRYANSPEEAVNALNFGGATAIYKWTPPKVGEEGYVEGVFYTQKHQNYHKTLQLEHKDRLVIDRQLGVELEKTLGDKWSIKAGVNFDSPGDPTAKGAPHLAVGYKTGNYDNWFSLSLGAQYRPFDGSRIVGTTDFLQNPTFLMGADIRGKWTPLKYEYVPNHFMAGTLTGNLSGAFLALNKEKENDAGKVVLKDKVGYDVDYISGLPDANLGLRYGFLGTFGDKLHYSTGVFGNYDASLAVAAIAMGAKNPAAFFNTGVDARLLYEQGGFEAGVGGKYLFTQVNNKEASGAGVNVGYDFGKFKIFGAADYMKAIDGNRFLFTEGAKWTPNKNFNLSGVAQQEVVLPDSGKAYMNPGGTNFMLNAEAKF